MQPAIYIKPAGPSRRIFLRDPQSAFKFLPIAGV
jgi:hypothetical protein